MSLLSSPRCAEFPAPRRCGAIANATDEAVWYTLVASSLSFATANSHPSQMYHWPRHHFFLGLGRRMLRRGVCRVVGGRE